MEEVERNNETDLSKARRGTTKKQEILYKFCRFEERIPFEVVESILTDAKTALNGIYGEAAMLLETRVFRICQERIVYIDGNTFLGQCLAKAFTALLAKAYGPRLFEIQRVRKQETLVGLANN